MAVSMAALSASKGLRRRLCKTTCWTSKDTLAKLKTMGMSLLGDAGMDSAVQKLPTGALGLDMALGGGLAKGRIIEVFGPEASGKTSISLMALAASQAAGELAVFIDAEHALDIEWAEKIGVNKAKLVFYQPESGEDALQKVIQVLSMKEPGLIVVDSVSQLTPSEELEKGMDQSTIGLQARMMSKAMRKITGLAREANCTVIFINQIRMKIGGYGNPETRSGGNALKYAASQILDVRRKDYIKGPGDITVGNKLMVKVVKNKVSPPHRSAMLEISYEAGIKRMASMVEAATNLGVLTRKGAWYYLGDRRLGMGMEKLLAALDEDENLKGEIDGLARNAALPGDAKKDDVEHAENGEDEIVKVGNSKEKTAAGAKTEKEKKTNKKKQ